MPGLGDRHIQVTPETGGERLQHPPLLLEGVTVGEVEVESRDTEDHRLVASYQLSAISYQVSTPDSPRGAWLIADS
jgi:hypothetical protein